MIKVDVRKSVKCNGEWGLFISFPYNQDVVNAIREFPSRFWDKTNKEWEIPFNSLSSLLEKLSMFEIELTGDSSAFAPKQIVEAPADFEFYTKPFDHQIEGFNYGLQHDKWLLGDEQGLGKTKQIIDLAVAKKLQNGFNHCLIICGVNGLKWNWQNEIRTHSTETGWILGQRRRKKDNGWKIGSNSDKLDDLKNINQISSYFIITNVESLRDDKISSELAKLCKSGEIGLVAIDEIHKCKNPSSQQGKGILKIKADNCIAMTGTPLMNSPMDLYIILKWLGFEKHAYYAFKQHYCVLGGFGGHETIGYKNLEELQEQLNGIMLRRLKKDVLDLPEKLFVDEYVEMTGKQEQIYKEVTNETRMNIDKIKSSPNPLAQLIRMRQATGYTGILSSTVLESAKLDRMEELVDEAVANGQQVVIFSNWTQMTDAVQNRLRNKPYAVSIITGETKDADRQHNVNEFQNGVSKVIVGTIGAMGTGLTLTAGTVEIFLDEPWTMASKEQAIDRCHRIGAKSNVTIYTLIAKNTIDERIHELVQKKGAMADAIVDGKLAVGRGDVVDWLLS